MVSRWECADCGLVYQSKTQLKKHQRKQRPRHSGGIPVKDKATPPAVAQKQRKTTTTTTAGTTTVGNRAKGTYRPASNKKDGPIEPEYESGVIRVSDEAWEKIASLIPENIVHRKVEATGHHLLFFDGKGYSDLDFMMYEHNFCEQEMFYEDLLVALNNFPNDEKIKIQDMGELGISTVESVMGQIINCTPESESDMQTLSVQELSGLISPLRGLAIAYGRFKPKPRVSTYGANRTQNSFSKKRQPIRKPVSKATPLNQSKTALPAPKGQKKMTDFMNEKWEMKKPLEEDDEQDDFGVGDDFVWDQVTDWDYSFGAEGYTSRGWGGGGWGGGGYSTASRTAVALEPKYHPIYGIKGMKIQVDRYVDLTPMIEADEGEVKEAEETKCSSCGEMKVNPFGDFPHCVNLNCPDYVVEESEWWGSAETFEASEGGFKLNVATLPVDEAYEWSLKQFEQAGLNMEEYIPHFKENYASLQEECQGALDVPRIEMPVIDPEQLEEFATSLMTGQLDVFEPFAEGRKEVYSPKDLYGDTNRAWKFLFLGLQDGMLQDDVVTARIQRTVVGLMRPTQSQIWLEKLIGNIIQFGEPQEDGSGCYSQDSIILRKTIAISQEGFILDGHHRYAQIALVNPALRMRTLYIALPMRRLLDISRPYGNAIGNEQRG